MDRSFIPLRNRDHQSVRINNLNDLLLHILHVKEKYTKRKILIKKIFMILIVIFRINVGEITTPTPSRIIIINVDCIRNNIKINPFGASG